MKGHHAANYANTNDVFAAFSANAATPIILGSTAGKGGGYAPLRIYGLKIYESGSLVREYVPYVKNGAPGLKYGNTFVKIYWDANNGKNGIPKAGGNVTVSADRDRDAFVLFSGSQNVDTEILLDIQQGLGRSPFRHRGGSPAPPSHNRQSE